MAMMHMMLVGWLFGLGRLGPDPRNDLVGLVLGNLSEFKHGVTVLGGAKKR